LIGSLPPEPFEVEDAGSGAHHTLVLSGDLDIASSATLKETLLEVSGAGTTGVTLDLRGLTFIDSTGLFMILYAKELADIHGYELSLVPGPRQIQRVFELTALLEVLPFQADDEDAGEAYTATELG
jgi:anti-sigma B factor antagonist